MKRRIPYLLLLTLSAFALSYCAPSGGGTSSAREAANAGTGSQLPIEHIRKIKPPVPSLDVPFVTQSLKATKGMDWKLPGGTRLVIPANAFVFADGTPATGNIDLRYREFRNVADIVRSGIPMEYDSAGQTQSFSSAGMMELRGSCEGREVEIAPGKTIQVELASQRPGLFNLYAFDEKAGNWQNLQNNLTEANKPADKAGAQVSSGTSGASSTPKLVQTGEPYVFTIRAKAMPGLEDLNGTEWAALSTTLPGFADLNNNPQLMNEVWEQASLDPYPGQKGLFQLKLTNNKRSLTLLARPDNPQLVASLTPRSAVVTRQAPPAPSPYRVFGMSRLGVYNCDRILHNSNKRQIMASYKVEGAEGVDISIVYLVLPSENSVIYQYSIRDMVYDKSRRNGLMVTFSDGSVALVSPDEFKQQANSSHPTFALKPVHYDLSAELERDILAM